MTEEEYNEKLNIMDKCVEYWKQKADRLDKKISNLKVTYRKQRNKEIDKLQKENAEAEGIIKKLMEFAEIDNREYEEAYKEAKQFLKEE